MTVFSFHATATNELYTLSLHDALPISGGGGGLKRENAKGRRARKFVGGLNHESTKGRKTRNEKDERDRKSTRLNSSHVEISYAVFCLKKKNKVILLTFSLLLMCLHFLF